MKNALLKDEKYCCPECGSEITKDSMVEKCDIIGDQRLVDFTKCVNENKRKMTEATEEANTCEEDPCFGCPHNILEFHRGTLMKLIEYGNAYVQLHQCQNCQNVFMVPCSTVI